jgi:hypothetical protein
MTLTAEKPQRTDAELAALDLELTLTGLDGTLTEARYDEIVAVLLPHCQFIDAAMTMLTLGEVQWRQKWHRRMGDYFFLDSAKPNRAQSEQSSA